MPRRKREPIDDLSRAFAGIVLLGAFLAPGFVSQLVPQLKPYSWQITVGCFGVALLSIVIGAIIALPILNERRREQDSKEAEVNLLYRRLVDLSPTEFEKAMCRLFEMQGFTVQHVGQRGDGGVDMRMSRQGQTFIGQCKRYEKNAITVEQIRDFYGALVHSGADQGYFITTSRFTRPAVEFAKHKPLTLVDGPMLKAQISKQGSGARI